MARDNTTLAGGEIRDREPTGLYAGGWREIWRIDRDGRPYRIWERIVPRIDDSVLDCALYLYESEEDASQGAHYGGSGFLVGVPLGWDRDDWRTESRAGRAVHIYAVTNAHVIENGCSVIRLNTKEGATRVIDSGRASWLLHPDGDDLAITPIEPDPELHKFRYLGVGFDMFVTQERLRDCGIGPGDETFAVGRFVGRDERQSNRPIVRVGHISGLGTELIDQGQERHNFKQESFLVESHSIPGFSGSPVFVWVPLERTVKIRDPERASEFRKGVRSYQHRPREYFLGIDWGHLDEQNLPGMAGVVPAWKLLEVLSVKQVVEMRLEKEKSESKKVRRKLDVRPREQKSRAGQAVPVPSRADFMRDLGKVTRRKTPSA
jgi:hypothetical protein